MIIFCSMCHRARLFTQVKPFIVKRNVQSTFIRHKSNWNVQSTFIRHKSYKVLQSTFIRYKSNWNTSVVTYVEGLVNEYNQLKEKLLNLNDLSSAQMKKYGSQVQRLQPAVQTYKNIKSKQHEMLEIKNLGENDAEFRSLADEEMTICQVEIDELKLKLLDLIIPRDEDDGNNAILEVRAGAGGREAGLFAAEIFSMYKKLAILQNWKFDIVTLSENIEGGLNKAAATVAGENVFGMLKYEIGVHRVQRVPSTESSGRLHTSTTSVIILPQPSNISAVFDMKDVKVDTFRSSGAGGMHVNKTESAVRLTHLPTGIVVSCQEQRSQIKNKSKAIQILTAKLYDMERTRVKKEQYDVRQSQLGTGDRSERIRTYNFPQNRVTDHRIGETFHGVDECLSAGPSLLELIGKLKTYEKTNALLSITAS